MKIIYEITLNEEPCEQTNTPFVLVAAECLNVMAEELRSEAAGGPVVSKVGTMTVLSGDHKIVLQGLAP